LIYSKSQQTSAEFTVHFFQTRPRLTTSQPANQNRRDALFGSPRPPRTPGSGCISLTAPGLTLTA
jgi:hypothetical protein